MLGYDQTDQTVTLSASRETSFAAPRRFASFPAGLRPRAIDADASGQADIAGQRLVGRELRVALTDMASAIRPASYVKASGGGKPGAWHLFRHRSPDASDEPEQVPEPFSQDETAPGRAQTSRLMRTARSESRSCTKGGEEPQSPPAWLDFSRLRGYPEAARQRSDRR